MGSFTFKSIAGFLLVLFSIAILLPSSVRAITGADPTTAASTWSQSSAGVAVSGGTVYNATVSTSEQTYRWTALWGNVSGSVVLNNEDGKAVISWTVTSVQDNSVFYATTNAGTLDPTDFTAFNTTDVTDADTAYGYLSAVTDSITNTFTSSATFQSPSMDAGITANTTTLEGTWVNYLFKFNSTAIPKVYPTGQDYLVWAVEIQNDQLSFYGTTADYELLIPENEEVGQGEGASTTYYFWLEFN